nr:hypothetical protein CFP56_33310 [Quercus suber]
MTENIVTTLAAEDYVNPGPDPRHDPHHPPAIDVSISLGNNLTTLETDDNSPTGPNPGHTPHHPPVIEVFTSLKNNVTTLETDDYPPPGPNPSHTPPPPPFIEVSISLKRPNPKHDSKGHPTPAIDMSTSIGIDHINTVIPELVVPESAISDSSHSTSAESVNIPLVAQNTINVPPASIPSLRRSSRPSKAPTYLKDYKCSTITSNELTQSTPLNSNKSGSILPSEDYVNPGPNPKHDPHHPLAINVSISLGKDLGITGGDRRDEFGVKELEDFIADIGELRLDPSQKAPPKWVAIRVESGLRSGLHHRSGKSGVKKRRQSGLQSGSSGL